MTHSIGDCQIASDVSTDRQLGKFYVDNVFIEKYNNLPDEIYKVLDYELIGKQARGAEGGVFTDNGYVVHNGELSQEYSAGNAATLPRTNYTIMLELSYNGRMEYPMLPADDGMLVRAIAQLGARSLQECTITVSECAVPQLAELISPSLLQEPNSLVEVNELAIALLRMLRLQAWLPSVRTSVERYTGIGTSSYGLEKVRGIHKNPKTVLRIMRKYGLLSEVRHRRWQAY